MGEREACKNIYKINYIQPHINSLKNIFYIHILMIHLTNIITECELMLKNNNTINKEELVLFRDFLFPDNQIKYINLEELNYIKNKNKGFIMISNHVSVLADFILTNTITNAYTISAAELFLDNQKIMDLYNDIVKKCNIILYATKNINKDSGDKLNNNKLDGISVKQIILDKINSGNNIIVYPEGFFSHKDYLYKFKKGLFHLAYQNNIPMLPVIIDYKNNTYYEDKYTNFITLESQLNTINTHMTDDSGIDVNILKFIYPENFDTFDAFYNYAFNIMNNKYIQCRNTNKN